MIRFFAMHRDPLRGSHLHLVLTVHERVPLARALDRLREHRTATAPNQHPVLWFDFGPGDSDLRRLDQCSPATAPERF